MIQFKNINFYALLCGGLSFLLGASVMFGWYSGNVNLIQVNPVFAPMQYNTALGFLLVGTGSVLLVIQKHRVSRFFGLVVFLIGIATLFQYIAHIDLGIDQVLMNQDIMTKTSHPGRMAPNTALCFSLSGLALLLGARQRATMVSLSAAVLVLSVIAFMGYMIQEESIYGWGQLTRMAIHTATGFVVSSGGMLFYGLLRQGRRKFDAWELVPFSLAVIVVVITLLSWYSIKDTAQVRNQRYFDTLIADTEEALKNRYALYEQSMWGGLGLFYASKSVERNEWKAYVAALDIEEKLPGINGIGYIAYVLEQNLEVFLEKVRIDGAPDFKNYPETPFSDKFPITFIEPIEDNYKALGLDIGFEANRREAAERARDLGVPALTKKIELVQDNKKQAGFLLLVPAYVTKKIPSTLEERRAHFQGWVYAPFIGSNFMRGLNAISDNQVSFNVYDGEKIVPEALIYTGHPKDKREVNALFTKQTNFEIAGRTWTMTWCATDQFLAPASKGFELIVVMLGMFFAGFLYFTLSRLLRSKESIRIQVEERTEQLAESESRQTFLKNLLIYSNEAETQDEFLRIVLETVCRYIGWPVGHAYLWDAERHILKPSCRWYLEDGGVDFSEFKKVTEGTFFKVGEGLPGRVCESRKPVWVEDVAIDQNFPRNKLLTDINVHSGFALPVFLNGEIRVVLEFFSSNIIEEDKELMQLWDAAGGQLSRVIERGEIEEERVLYTKELEQAKDEASRANIMKSEFLANMSHEIRTPLNGVIGAADLLKKTETSDNQNKYLSIITGAGETLLALINDILDLSKIESGELEINPEIANFRELIRTSLQSILPRANNKNIELAVHYKGTIPVSIMIDTVRFNQVMINLLGNAAKFVEKGYIAVHIEELATENGQITLRVMVEDSGIGIAKDKLKTIFEKFEQADATTTKKYGGTGLGLAITLRLIELMGGEIGVESEVGVGTKFWFELTVPVVEDRNVEKAEEIIKEIEDLKVLLVDDLEVSRTFLSSALEMMGIHCDIAQSAKEGLHIMEEAEQVGRPFDVVLIDYQMPVVDGLEMAKKIRERKESKDTKLILISALGKLDVAALKVEELVEEGPFNGYLLKPIDAHDLRQKLYEIAVIGDNYEAVQTVSIERSDEMTLEAHILLVENEMVNQMVATDMLEQMGCRVDLAENGQEALDMLAASEGQYNVVLMDCMMPVMDGFEATQAIRAREADDDTHQIIIAMTANAMAGEKDKCLKIGMDDYLAKPVKEEVLYAKLKEYIKERKSS